MDSMTEFDIEAIIALDAEGEVDLEDGQIHLEEYTTKVPLEIQEKIMRGEAF